MNDELSYCAHLGPFWDQRGLRPAGWTRLCSDLDTRKTSMLVEDWQSREQFERNLDMAKIKATA
jgi:hypothetical protein